MTHPFYQSRLMYWPYGFHCTATGDLTGVGDYIRACRARGVPVSIYSTDSAGVVLEALESGSHPDDCIGFRFTSIPDVGDVDRLPVDPETGLYAGDPEEQFDRLYDIHEQHFPPELRPYQDRIWRTYVNEPNTYRNENEYNQHDSEYLAKGFLHIIKRSLLDEKRYAFAGWASGNPHYEFWRNNTTLELLRLAGQHPRQIGINWHLYSLDNADLLANFGDHIGRYKYLYDVCQAEGIAPPYIIAAEFGWGESALTATPEQAILQMAAVQNEAIVNRFWGGCCMWTLGKWGGSIVRDMIRLLPYNTDMITNYQPVRIPEIDGGQPPMDKPKIVIVKKPQKSEMTELENEQVSRWAWENYGRTTTHSTDDMLTMLAGGNDESYAVLWWSERQPDAEAALLDAGYNYIMMPDEPQPPSNPLTGLKLGYLFEYQYSDSYSPFNAPRDYGNKLHEGLDADVIGGQADNKVDVLCTYDGVVERSLDSTGGYGKYVRVQHGRNGSIFYTRYCHLDARFVDVGDYVQAGDPIGEVGSTGNADGEHVHFNLEVPGYGLSGYVVADVVDPFPYLPSDNMSLPPLNNPPPPTGELINVGSYQIAHPAAWRVVYNIDPNGARSGQDIRDMDLGGGLMVRSKSGAGTSAEWWRFDDSYAYLVADTSHGFDTMYTIAKGGTVGNAPKNPLQMRIGELWTEQGTHYVQVKTKDGCKNVDGSGTGYATNTAKLLWRNQAYKFPRMPVTLDVIALLTTNGETQLYAKTNQQSADHYSVPVGLSIGWGGWLADWGRAELEELYWNRGELTQEPNRFCGW